MKFGEVIGRIDRFQRTFWFKVVASSAIALIGLVVVATYMISLERARKDNLITVVEPDPSELEPLPADPIQAARVKQMREEETAAHKRTAQALNLIFESRYDPTSVAVGSAVVVGLLVGFIK